ncbi:hypothetical protein [uncultured Roseobacter sp.]|uniref:hypothetical protein n=1 Tax=uncultured Roseobacter sp. TaxID=114847 RepID=UPI00262A560F|nr:hypothetical protein [uncultured Roseobacter sp.]
MTRGILGYIAAGLAGLTAAAHILIGTFDTVLPLWRSDLPFEIQGALQACFHFVSLFLLYSSWSFARAAPGAAAIARLWIGFGLCFLAVGIAGGALWSVPQWLLLLPTGVVALAAVRPRESA